MVHESECECPFCVAVPMKTATERLLCHDVKSLLLKHFFYRDSSMGKRDISPISVCQGLGPDCFPCACHLFIFKKQSTCYVTEHFLYHLVCVSD